MLRSRCGGEDAALRPDGRPSAAKRRRTGARAALTSLGITVAVVAVGAAVWWKEAAVDPVIHLPEVVMPTPNARDYFLKAAQQRVEPDALRLAYSSTPTNRASFGRGRGRWYSPAEKERLVARNAEALQTFRAGLRHRFQEQPPRSMNDFSRLHATSEALRRLCELVALERQVRVAQADWSGAMQSVLDGAQLGLIVPRGGGLSGALMGAGLERMTRGRSDKIVRELDATTARAAARRLESLLAQRVSYAQSLDQDRWLPLIELARGMRGPNGQVRLAKELSPNPGGSPPDSDSPAGRLDDGLRTVRQVPTAFLSKRMVVEQAGRYLDQLIARARLPYRTARAAPDPPMPRDAVNRLMLPSFSEARFPIVQCETNDVLLLVSLGLQAYRREHGTYPEGLSALVPGYLKAVPADPYGSGELLRYFRRGASHVLYSIGPDGVDDQGRPALNAQYASQPRRRYYVEEPCRGDVVAGLNY
jgi:hypothetical protein